VCVRAERIAIARAMLRHPQLALCDEATAALDSDAERRVQEALDAMLQQPGNGDGATHATTSVVIAHRLSTIRDADVIYVLDRGVVVEQVSMIRDLAMSGRYASGYFSSALFTDNIRVVRHRAHITGNA
jgi:ABC-type multidrug transport system fused ATPase/permease subunit